jgi:hypothetical protein
LIPAIALRPDHHLRIGLDGAIVAKAWLFREVVCRRCINILHSLVSSAECEALRQFHDTLQAAVAHVEPSMLAAARQALTPADTVLVIECSGSEDVAPNIDNAGAVGSSARLEAEIVVVLTAPSTLVLFEYLSREVDDRDGRNLLASFVSPSEYWALMATQCHLEPGAFYAIDRDYPVQVNEAREWLCSSGGGDCEGIAPSGCEDR